jgi:ATP-dependent Lon protease
MDFSNNQIIPADQILPNRLVLLPLKGKPIFPGIFTPMMISSQEDLETAGKAVEGDQMMGLILSKNENTDAPAPGDLYQVGTAAKIVKKMNLPDGGMNIFISSLKRFRIKKIINSTVPITAAVEYLDDEIDDSDEVKALTRALIGEMKEVSEGNPLFSEEMRLNMVNIDNPGKIADFVTSILNINRENQQKILEITNIRNRLEQALVYLKQEHELLRIQKKIQKQINEKIEKSQREYFLKEELKAIQQELGMPVDSKSTEYQRFADEIQKLNMEGEVKEQVEQELEKFKLMDPNSSEFHVTRNYLDTIISLPWKEPKPEDIDMQKAHGVLEKDHYGLEDVKERILEFLAVRKLKESAKGSIICLVGPPGVGKTSIGHSIARALDKKFFRFSVGGMRDEAEIKGHRRTYVGAMPGKIIQGLKIVKTKDPVFMIDEIDKLGVSYQGDPSSALLEVLDPEQNISFRDHYLDLPFDVSNILFITTANTLDTIPGPLRDRMEIIRLPGYVEQEKIEIAKRYLIPKSRTRNGIPKGKVKFHKSGLQAIAQGYSREAGLRNFEKSLDKIHRKVAKDMVFTRDEGGKLKDFEPVTIKKDNTEDYLGKPSFQPKETKKRLKPGMVTGLAWTPYGGDTLTIEAVANRGKESFRLTGQLGDVMQESANIAYTYVRNISEKYDIPLEFFEKNTIHLHIPAGAIPKDGPSAGITMASTLLSLGTGKKVKDRLAMTGELSLTGDVLPIGGLKEKVIAAQRERINKIIFPKQNERDLAEIPEKVKKKITFYPVESMEEVIEHLFS